MEFCDRLINLRKSKGLSQEQLGSIVDVSRQTISKWELGQTTPEMDKLKVLSDYFEITLDELVNGDKDSKYYRSRNFEYTSITKINDIPLVHINLGRGLKKAKGIIAIGNVAIGVVSIGLFSLGLISIGLFALGVLAFGSIVAGMFAVGGISIGYMAIGGVAVGIYAIGGVAVGYYSVGGAAIASRVAIGDYANGDIAIGRTVIGNTKYLVNEGVNESYLDEILATINTKYPGLNASFIKEIIMSIE